MSSRVALLPKGRLPLVLIILLFFYVCFFYRLGQPDLTDPDESRYAETAREMLEQKEWVTPLLNYEPRLEKPPLFYWFVALSYEVFGINEWAGRLFPACFAALGVALIYFLASQLLSPTTGFLASLILCTTIIYLALARLVITDMLLTLCITGALSAFAIYYFQNKKELWPVIYVSVGLAVMTKGPVGLLVPAIIICSFLLLRGEGRKIRELRPLLGLAIIVVIVLPWLSLLALQHKGIFKYYLWQETLKRFFTPELEHQKPIYYFPLILLGGSFPWALFLVPAVFSFARGGIKKAIISNPVSTFFWLWVLAPLVFFSLSQSKLPTYINPVFPAVAIISARWIEKNVFARIQVKTLLTILSVVTISIAVSFIGLHWAQQTYGFYHKAAFISLEVILAFVILAGLLAVFKQGKAAVGAVLTGCLIFIVLFLPVVDQFTSRFRSTRDICYRLQQHLQPQDELIYFESDTRASSIFYLRRPIPSVEEEQIGQYLPANGTLFVLLRPRHLDDLLNYLTQSPRIIVTTNRFLAVAIEKD